MSTLLPALGGLSFAVVPVLAFIEGPRFVRWTRGVVAKRRADRFDFGAIHERHRASDALVTRGWN